MATDIAPDTIPNYSVGITLSVKQNVRQASGRRVAQERRRRGAVRKLPKHRTGATHSRAHRLAEQSVEDLRTARRDLTTEHYGVRIRV